MQTIQELKSMSETELDKTELELKKKLLKTTYELKISQSEHTSEPKKLKKAIARIQTIKSERGKNASGEFKTKADNGTGEKQTLKK